MSIRLLGRRSSNQYVTAVPLLIRQYPASEILVGTATAFTITGPVYGAVGVASGLITVTPNGNYTGTITLTDSVGGDTLSPTSLTWSGTSNGLTFQVTPSTAGPRNLNGTASPSLTAPSNFVYTAISGGGAGQDNEVGWVLQGMSIGV